MAILQPSDFTENPTYNIALTSTTESELPALIDQIEKDNLQELLGCDLYDLFIADLTNDTPQTPQTQLYKDIFEAFCKDNVHCGIQRSFGIRDMLMAFVYFAWHNYTYTQDTASGMVAIDSENSSKASPDAAGLFNKYNRGIQSYKSIQWFILDNPTIYPKFEGIRKEFTSYL